MGHAPESPGGGSSYPAASSASPSSVSQSQSKRPRAFGIQPSALGPWPVVRFDVAPRRGLDVCSLPLPSRVSDLLAANNRRNRMKIHPKEKRRKPTIISLLKKKRHQIQAQFRRHVHGKLQTKQRRPARRLMEGEETYANFFFSILRRELNEKLEVAVGPGYVGNAAYRYHPDS